VVGDSELVRASGGGAVVAGLEANGVDTLFGLPGIQLDHLFNALHDARDRITVITARHEQGAAYMALGAAQATGAPAAYACVPGPGFLNTAAALSTAYAVYAPVLALVGQIAGERIGLGGGSAWADANRGFGRADAQPLVPSRAPRHLT
jgi:acetolactate synthase I/II/III large subunit